MNPTRLPRAAFSLIEVVIALSVTVFCLSAIFGLLPIGLTSNNNASEQTVTAGIATAISADLHSTPVVGWNTSRFGLKIPPAGGTSVQTLYFSQDGQPGAIGVITKSGPTVSRYRATVTMTAQNTLTTPATASTTPYGKLFKTWVLITWPAMSDPAATTFPSNFSGSFETVGALNCN